MATKLVPLLNENDDRLNLNGNNHGNNRNNFAFGMALATKTSTTKTYKNLYNEVISFENLFLAYKKARKGKTKKDYVIEFEKNLIDNIFNLHNELKNQTYKPKPLQIFILRDPKTRKISKSDFVDRIVHHALVRVIEPVFDKTFIPDSCANRKGKGNLYALERFNSFKGKVTNNLHSEGFCLKADIKHYFQEIDHEILVSIVRRKIVDEKVLWLIEKILQNTAMGGGERKLVCHLEI